MALVGRSVEIINFHFIFYGTIIEVVDGGTKLKENLKKSQIWNVVMSEFFWIFSTFLTI